LGARGREAICLGGVSVKWRRNCLGKSDFIAAPRRGSREDMWG
jgi:hypothetical protein